MIQSPVLDLVLPITKQFETGPNHTTFAPTAYRDGEGNMTIGFGHKLTVNDPLLTSAINEVQAQDLLGADLDRQNSYLVACLGDQWTELTFGQQAALIDFCFNLGIGRFERSTLHHYIACNRLEMVPTELGRWVYVGQPPQISAWQQKRRAADVALWNTKAAA